MPQYNRAELGRMATESGFVRDTFEKVLRLKEILRFMNEDEFLREHLLLKGGTAINLTVFNLPRLSVDIDMDYTPNDTREDMLECREKITNVIKEYMESEGYLLSDASRFSHSLDAFHYNYQNAGGNRDMIKIELNYSLRAHIFEPVYRSILPETFDDGMKIHLIKHLTPQLLTHLISTKSEEIYFQCLIRKIIFSWMRERRLRRITYRTSWC